MTPWRNTLEQQRVVNDIRAEEAERVRKYTKPSRPAGRPLGRSMVETAKLTALAASAVKVRGMSLAEASRQYNIAPATIRARLRKMNGAS